VEEANGYGSTISFIQANLQHSIAASGITTRTVRVKGMDMALIQEPWYHEESIRGLTFQDIPCTPQKEGRDPELVSLRGT